MSGRAASAPTILHVLCAGDASAMQARCISLIAALDTQAAHAIAMEGADRLEGTERLSRKIRVTTLPSFPPLAGQPWPGRLKRLAAAMAGHRLICTWGAGALDAVLAHTLFADVYKLPPLVHHEAEGGRRRGTLFRRIALGRTAALVVPDRTLERLALGPWQQPRSRVRLIPDGIDTAAFAATPRRDAVPGLVKRKGELWLGTTGAEDVNMLRPLLDALKELAPDWQLVVAGEALPREAVHTAAAAAGVEDRVLPTTIPAQPERLIGLFDLFTPLSADHVREAMAAGLALAGPRSEAIDDTIASDNGPFLTPPGDGAALTAELTRLAADAALRHRIGEANRARARAEFDQRRMMDQNLAIWRGLIGKD